MTLRIISPAEILFEGEVTSVTLPGTKGSFTILRNHASLISSLTSGQVVFSRNKENNDTEKVDVAGGIVVVENNVISVCVD